LRLDHDRSHQTNNRHDQERYEPTGRRSHASPDIESDDLASEYRKRRTRRIAGLASTAKASSVAIAPAIPPAIPMKHTMARRRPYRIAASLPIMLVGKATMATITLTGIGCKIGDVLLLAT
jgi:hypothetical protein